MCFEVHLVSYSIYSECAASDNDDTMLLLKWMHSGQSNQLFDFFKLF